MQFLKSGESPSKVAITVAKKIALGRANERPWVLELLRLKLAIASAKWNSESKFPGIEATHLVVFSFYLISTKNGEDPVRDPVGQIGRSPEIGSSVKSAARLRRTQVKETSWRTKGR